MPLQRRQRDPTLMNRQHRTLLQWLAPELARAGLVRNEEWIPRHAEEAGQMFGSKSLAIAATMMACAAPYAIDYLRQAPILATLLTSGNDCGELKVRKSLAEKWPILIRNGPKLRDLLEACGAALPLRALNGQALAGRRSELDVIKLLSDIPPSRLAQIIPKQTAPRLQSYWLMALSEWTSIMERRSGSRCYLFDWAASAISDYFAAIDFATFASADFYSVEICCLNVNEIADYVLAGNHLNLRWDWLRARDEALAWHRRQVDDRQFARELGVGWREPLSDYRGLPEILEINGFTIVALRSGSALFEDGQAMRHCVASYARDIIGGDCFIYSVQRCGKRIATFELRFAVPVSSALRYRLMQLKGPCNNIVATAVGEVVNRFVDWINTSPPRQRLQ
jgi:PcfJ-like protein